ncbi:MAG: hypothetical protein M3N47_06725 [Chloroflexota bacterium]|nr:hypothetical protein [Chloroflexota bacterium]
MKGAEATHEHPDLLPTFRERIAEFSAIRTRCDEAANSGAHGSSQRWFEDVRGGKHILVVVALDRPPVASAATAYIARRLSGGILEWTRS